MEAPLPASFGIPIPTGFEVVGELGRDEAGFPVYLAREVATKQLVALRPAAETAAAGGLGRAPAVIRSLGSAVPAGARRCHICGGAITDWRAYCPRCGTDVTGRELLAAAGDSAAEVVRLVQESAGSLDVLGAMPREQGGAPVHFARDRTTGEIVALTVTRDDARSLSLTVTSLTGSGRAPAEGPGRDMGMAARASGPVAEDARSIGSTAMDDPSKVCPSCSLEFGPAVRFCPHDGSVLRLKDATDALIGRVIAERFHVLRKLGQGGMGQVYLAEHVKMGRKCALKVMHRALSQDVSAITRFAREAANASRINHTNVATIYDFGETDDRLIYIAMELVDGVALSKILETEGTLAPARAVQFGRQIADALEAAHAEGVVHRDLKPDNILVARPRGGGEVVKVVDFGIAKAMVTDGDGLTRTGFVVGTPRYMSPEQLIADEVDARTDVYSLGCVLYEMLVGEPVFGERTVDVARRLTERAPRVRSRNASVPAALDDVVARALERSADQRFQSAAELGVALDVPTGAVSQTEANWLSRLWPARRRPADATRSRAATAERGQPVGTPTPDAALPEAAEAVRLAEPISPGPAPVAPAAALPSTMDPARVADAAAVPTGEDPTQTMLAAAAHSLQTAKQPSPNRHRRAMVAALAIAGLLLAAGGVRWGMGVLGAPEDRPAAPVAGPGPVAAPPIGPSTEPTGSAGQPTGTSGQQTEGTGPETGTPEPTTQNPPAPRPESTGTLRLEGDLPPGVRVSVGDRLYVPGNDGLSLPPGEHVVRASADGYEPEAWTVTIRADRITTLRSALRPVPTAPVVEPESTTGRDPDPTPPDSEPAPTTFEGFVRRDMERFRQALEARDLERARAVFRAPLPESLVTALADALDHQDVARLSVAVQVREFMAPRAIVYLRIADAANPNQPLYSGMHDAEFLQRTDGWLPMLLAWRNP